MGHTHGGRCLLAEWFIKHSGWGFWGSPGQHCPVTPTLHSMSVPQALAPTMRASQEDGLDRSCCQPCTSTVQGKESFRQHPTREGPSERMNGLVTHDSYESLLIDSRSEDKHMHALSSSETVS